MIFSSFVTDSWNSGFILILNFSFLFAYFGFQIAVDKMTAYWWINPIDPLGDSDVGDKVMLVNI